MRIDKYNKFKKREINITQFFLSSAKNIQQKQLKNKNKKVISKITKKDIQDWTNLSKSLISKNDVIIDPISCYWVENYAKKNNDLTQFFTHISMKCEEDIIENHTDIEFQAEDIVLCHLGNHCTCRNVFSSFKLKSYRLIKVLYNTQQKLHTNIYKT